MVTKLDVFVELYSRAGQQKITDIVKSLKQPQSEYDRIRKILEVLSTMKIIAKSRHRYAPVMNAKNQHLFDMLSYCIRNGVNYNDLLDETVAAYLSSAFQKKSFAAKDIKMHSRTFSKISNILEKNGFLIVLSRKPFRAIVPYNSLLGDVIAYYGYKPAVAMNQADQYFKAIEKELSIFRRLRVKNNRKYQEVLENFQIRFIHHSLSIEGNPITLAQTFKLLKEKVLPENVSIGSVNEVQNYQKAFLQMLQNVRNNSPIAIETILNYHFIAMQDKKEYAGKIRDGDVTIKGNKDFDVAPFKKIESLLNKLIDKYNAFLKGKKRSLEDVMDFAAYFHNEFQHIHPFFDGNSRTTRLITFHFLQMNDIPIFDIPIGMLEQYVLATKGAGKRIDKELGKALQRIVLYNLKTINEKLL